MALIGILIGLVGAAVGLLFGLMGGLLGIGLGLVGAAFGLLFHHFFLVLILIGVAWIVMGRNRNNTPPARLYGADTASPGSPRLPR